jgi:hypothetical protein
VPRALTAAAPALAALDLGGTNLAGGATLAAALHVLRGAPHLSHLVLRGSPASLACE